ncbi:hypothetical protein K470DRAFT_283172 [Piedraia hortae CBS 480.64]|uniref:GTP-binding protein n=1 Tax=Piedraia hortae CBS 480.64 TaxID=1314780 RepID=A0A6A7BV13_9PEZI|nr:hypothetical protein K470DRAFT_283172 [Piedraia hortae CBS 480.64]
MDRVKRKTRKVLLMGRSGAGKTSMRSIIFSNYVAKDVRRLGATVDVDFSNFSFMGNLTLNLWDCGGQDSFTESYFTKRRSYVFSAAAVLIFVFDISSPEVTADMEAFTATVRALREHSPNGRIFVLVHKMDLVPFERRRREFEQRALVVRTVCANEGFSNNQVECWASSIWDQTLYRAWARVIHDLVPQVAQLKSRLRKLSYVIEAREMVIYERVTCLAITHVTSEAEEGNPFKDRHERISSILKTHKQSMAKHAGSTGAVGDVGNFEELQIKSGGVQFFVTRLTENTLVAVVMGSGESEFNVARVNVALARAEFNSLESSL